ncbi:MAG TPA: hypothetical protein VGB85_25400 [Nannocystis sp.]|jgi:hypothetical protein
MRTLLAVFVLLAACGPQSGEGTAAETGASAGMTDEGIGTSTGASTASTSGTTEDPTGASTTSGTSEDPTGAGQCELAIGPLEVVEDDPHGCLGFTDEASCLAVYGHCTAIYGYPARCDTSWCRTASERVVIACRPLEICKEASIMVCRMTDAGIEAFWSERCVPPGFGRCEPGLPAGYGPPPACAP